MSSKRGQKRRRLKWSANRYNPNAPDYNAVHRGGHSSLGVLFSPAFTVAAILGNRRARRG